MRHWPILLCACVVIGTLAVWPSGLSRASQQDQPTAESPREKATQPPTSTSERSAHQESKADSASMTTEGQSRPVRIAQVPPPDAWYKAYVVATVVLALVTIGLAITGFLGIRTANRTLRLVESQARSMQGQLETMQEQFGLLKTQTSAAQTSADAAKESAEALVNSEKAWIFVEVRQNAERSMRVGAFVGGHAVCLECVITNQGRTPARLVDFQVRQESLAEEAALPETPDYGNEALNMDEMLLPPNDSIREEFRAAADKLRFFDSNEGCFYVYGVVNYLDVFGTKRYTRFCYTCWFPFLVDSLNVDELSFRRDGPHAYNRAT